MKARAKATMPVGPKEDTDWIATNDVVWLYPDGTRVPGRIAVSRPEQRSTGEWACRVGPGPLHNRFATVLGGDSWQALLLALQFFGYDVHYHIERGGKVLWPPNTDRRRRRDEIYDPELLLGALYRPLQVK